MTLDSTLIDKYREIRTRNSSSFKAAAEAAGSQISFEEFVDYMVRNPLSSSEELFDEDIENIRTALRHDAGMEVNEPLTQALQMHYK